MIKSYYKITVRDYDEMEKTGNISQFKSTWNILPTKLFAKAIKKELLKLVALLNNKEESDLVDEKEFWKVESEHKINAMRIAYYGIVNSIKAAGDFGKLHGVYASWIKKKLKAMPDADRFIKLSEQYCGIKIETFKDVTKLREQLQFRIDKYNENFNKPQKIIPKEFLMSEVIGIVSYLNLSFYPEMTVLEYLDARNRVMNQINKKDD